MIRMLEAKTVAGTRYGAGDVVNFVDVIEGQLVAAGAAESMPVVLTYTWATMPNYYTTPVGTVINLSDVGGLAGSFWKATAVGWFPLNGKALLAKNWGSVAAPVAPAISNTAGALFVPSGGAGSLLIPAPMLVPGHSTLAIRAAFHRDGTAASAIARIFLGTAGTISDAVLFSLGITTTDDNQARPFVEASPISASSTTTTNYLSAGNTGTPGVIATVTANINTAAAMVLSFGTSTVNAADSLSLIGYTVEIESI
ncbi:MAG: hypothetical protein ABI865_09140 [Nitrosospira sp.]